MYVMDDRRDETVTVWVYQIRISTDAFDILRNFFNADNNAALPFIIEDDFPNPVKIGREGDAVAIAQWCIFAFVAIVLSVCTYRLAGFITRRGAEFSIPQICLVLDMIALYRKFHPPSLAQLTWQ